MKKMRIKIVQIKISVESLTGRMDHVEIRISRENRK